ncbi:nucleoplasmin-3 [Erpetoichthys calabaricus]|uniref:nucleoplasmin-3 n=1 Tax=Erpetoichthys calabaricus TaxID=27687 RepID=UPI0022344338|nr:nucleoplasmin-3 [Erpetoichthys calabaricus]
MAGYYYQQIGGKSDRTHVERYFFTCELTSKVPSYTFHPEVDENADFEDHILEVRMVCLGSNAKNENNVVELTSLNYEGKEQSIPIVNLHSSCLNMVSLGDFHLKTPVTFRLKSGSGPVNISGLHILIIKEDEVYTLEKNEGKKEQIVPFKPAKNKTGQIVPKVTQ